MPTTFKERDGGGDDEANLSEKQNQKSSTAFCPKAKRGNDTNC